MKLDTVFLVGCGGVGSYLSYPLALTLAFGFAKTPKLVLVDGDEFEKKNLERQMFPKDQVGKNKAEVLAQSLTQTGVTVEVLPAYIHKDTVWDVKNACVISAVDNHTARRVILDKVDEEPSASAILAGNELTSAEAYFYQAVWKDTDMDPRVRYPSILTDTSDDPVVAAAGCATTEGLKASGGQTTVANYMASAFALHLFQAHYITARQLDDLGKQYLPVQHSNNICRAQTQVINEYVGNSPRKGRKA